MKTNRILSRESVVYLSLIGFGLIIMAVFLGYEWRFTGGLDGVPVDDSWIHYRFAENLRNSQGFSFNPGVPTPGSTAPLWTVTLSLIGFGYLIPSKILGIAAYLVVCQGSFSLWPGPQKPEKQGTLGQPPLVI